MNENLGPVQLFLRTKFTQKEIISTKRDQAKYISNLLNFLTTEDIQTIVEYREFLEKLSDGPEKKSPVYYFEKADKFNGLRNGWTYKTDIHGTGYYLNVKPMI
jgi:hypothetical protein